MNDLKEKITIWKKRIKVALKIKNIYSWIMGKVAIVTTILTIKTAIEAAWEDSKAKRR